MGEKRVIIVKLESVTKTFAVGSTLVKALDSVNFEAKGGEFLAIMGPSGSGKSTFLSIVGLLAKPTAGSVIFDGKNLKELTDKEITILRRERIGFVFQEFYLLPYLNSIENASLHLMFKGSPENERRIKAERILESMGIDGRKAVSKPNQLSVGEQQRVAIARALINDPKLLLCDEPTGNLDSKSAEGVMHVIKNLHRERGTTVIVVTHDSETAHFADKILHIRDGRFTE